MSGGGSAPAPFSEPAPVDAKAQSATGNSVAARSRVMGRQRRCTRSSSIAWDICFEAHSGVCPARKYHRTIAAGPYIAKLMVWIEGEQR